MNKHIKRSGSLIFIFYMLSQGIRLAANLFVARLLAPEMFGVMAMVLVVQQGLGMLSDVGIDAFVMRHKDYKNQQVLNTVWTVQVVRGFILFAVVLVFTLLLVQLQSAGITESWGVVNNSQLPILLAITSLNPVFRGFKSLSILVYARELKRLRIEVGDLLSQVFGVMVMLAWAWYSPSVWALVAASVITSFSSMVCSYVLFDVRHAFKWNKTVVNELYHFGKWIFIATALSYFAQQGDRIFLGMNISEAELGLYSIALILSGFATTLVQKVTRQLWLPVFSQKQDDIESLRKNYYRVRFMQDSFIGLFVLMTSISASSLIDVLYDDRYADVGWMLQLVIVSALAISIRSISRELLTALGETKVQMQVMIVNVVSLAILMPLLFSLYGLKGLIVATVISAFISTIPQLVKMYQKEALLIWNELRIIPWVLIIYLFIVNSF